jgi:hypothetical protein
MENTYLGILRGKMMPMEISAQMLLKGTEDKIFYLETKQMSGFTTKMTLRNALNSAKENNPENEQLRILIDELKSIKIDENQEHASSNVEQGCSFLDWIGL